MLLQNTHSLRLRSPPPSKSFRNTPSASISCQPHLAVVHPCPSAPVLSEHPLISSHGPQPTTSGLEPRQPALLPIGGSDLHRNVRKATHRLASFHWSTETFLRVSHSPSTTTPHAKLEGSRPTRCVPPSFSKVRSASAGLVLK